MYEVVVPKSVYRHWNSYQVWNNTAVVDKVFNVSLVDDYPEVLAARWVDDDPQLAPQFARAFTFESEEYYHWFLLKQ